MSDNQFNALHATALSPACHMPADPTDPKARAVAAADSAACAKILLNALGNRLSQDADTAADALIIEVAVGAMQHVIELLAPRQEVIPG